MLLGNDSLGYRFSQIGCKDTTKNAHTQEIATISSKKERSFFIIRQNKPIMLA